MLMTDRSNKRPAWLSWAFGLGLVFTAACWSGCIPYTVATTAHPIAEEQSPSASTSAYVVPNGLNLLRDSTTFSNRGAEAFAGVDTEARFRIDDASDLGVRVPTFSALIVNYKRRLAGADTSSFALAGMGGAGFVNAGQHAHFRSDTHCIRP